MGKTTDLFKKIRDTKETFNAKIGLIKDRNGMDLREAKSQREKERYKHLNAEFQRIARRDKKAFFSDQCKEMEEKNRSEKQRRKGQI